MTTPPPDQDVVAAPADGRTAEAARILVTDPGVADRSALLGAVAGNNPDVVEVLLDAGADPDAGRPIMAGAAHGDNRCLRLLLAHGAKVVAGTWTVGAAVHAGNAEGVALLLAAMQADGGPAAHEATEALADAENAPPAVVRALLDAGADPSAVDSDGLSALRRAVRQGADETAALLLGHGAPQDSTDTDRFVGACVRADRQTAEELLVRNPALVDEMTDLDRAAVVGAAASAPLAAVQLMLDLGFPPHARNGFGEQPLHTAAYFGRADVIRLLLDAGAGVDARDDRFEGTPLAYATVGSGERSGEPGDWVGSIRLLVDAGASCEDVWIPDKPPSEEVATLLRSYGIAPDAGPEPGPAGGDGPPAPLGTGGLADVARRVEAAYRSLDPEQLGGLLHPEVRWTQCRTRGEVLAWYRGLLAEGIRPTVESVEVDRDAVLLGLSLARHVEDARPAPADRLYQVFTVEAGQIVEIRGYPDRSAALARP